MTIAAKAPATAAAAHKRMQGLGTKVRAAQNQRYFKTGPGEYAEGDLFLGLTVPKIRLVARECSALPLPHVAKLLQSKWHEERLLALLILVRRYQRGTPKERNAIHSLYLRSTRYINNWDLVDLSAVHIVGPHLNGARRRLLFRLARSRSMWERRIAVLATFHYIKNDDFAHALRVAEMLLDDDEDLIHKAVGWMLREVGNRDRKTEEAFLRAHIDRMPRTALRYATEKFPERLRLAYLRM